MNSPPLDHYRELRVWQKAMDLVDAVYDLTETLPSDERFGLVGQLRRAVVSVPSNIAEGYGRNSKADYKRHLWIANGSLKEVETQLIICGRRGWITKDQAGIAWQHCQDVGKMLQALIRSL